MALKCVAPHSSSRIIEYAGLIFHILNFCVWIKHLYSNLRVRHKSFTFLAEIYTSKDFHISHFLFGLNPTMFSTFGIQICSPNRKRFLFMRLTTPNGYLECHRRAVDVHSASEPLKSNQSRKFFKMQIIIFSLCFNFRPEPLSLIESQRNFPSNPSRIIHELRRWLRNHYSWHCHSRFDCFHFGLMEPHGT